MEIIMSLFIQPPIQGVLAEFVSALFIIGAGIYLEYKKQERASIVFNVIGLIVTAFTTTMDIMVVPFLAVYLLSGGLVAFFNVKFLFGVFGSKMYGSLLLAVAIIHLPDAQNQIIEWLATPQLFYSTFIVLWLLIAFFAWIFGWLVKPKKHKQNYLTIH
jgi:hypothetical protein